MIRQLFARAVGFAVLALAASASVSAAEPTILATAGSAVVSAEPDGRTWTIGNNTIRYRVGRNTAGVLVAQALDRPDADVSWRLGQSPDLTFTSQSRSVTLGQSGVPFRSAFGGEERGGVFLRLVFDDQTTGLRVTRSYWCHPSAPAIETWTTFEAQTTDVTVGDIGVWQLSLAVNAVNWITGLQASATDGGRFTHRRETLTTRTTLELGSTTRSSVSAVPTVWFEGDAGQLFGAMLWSGAWRLTVSGPEPSGLTAVRFLVGQTTTTVRRGTPVESPHGVFGVAGGEPADVGTALRAYSVDALRQGRPMPALVTDNTWYAYGIKIDEDTIRAEMEQAASLGVEVFVVDAGWYAGGSETSDFTTGLGAWVADPKRFPNGLRALRDYAHDLGLKFGIWVEPERTATSLVGRTGQAKERFLATAGGRYNAGVRNENADAAQICLADREAREWLIGRLFAFLDALQPDYVKWDNNYWINCDRTTHGHGAGDGNSAHTYGLYDVLVRLRERYPEMVVENCAQGGNRLDLGMLRYTDVAWMDDVSGPSSHVRHNLTGLGRVFPPAYLLSFVMDDPAEPIHQADDMTLYFRSRMAGTLGLSVRGGEFGDDDRAMMQNEIAVYKRMRDTVADAVLVPLTGQSAAAGSDDWEALQWFSPADGNLVAVAYAGNGAPPVFVLRPQEIEADAEYLLSIPRATMAVRVRGRDLLERGFLLRRWPFSNAYVLFVTRQREEQ